MSQDHSTEFTRFFKDIELESSFNVFQIGRSVG